MKKLILLLLIILMSTVVYGVEIEHFNYEILSIIQSKEFIGYKVGQRGGYEWYNRTILITIKNIDDYEKSFKIEIFPYYSATDGNPVKEIRLMQNEEKTVEFTYEDGIYSPEKWAITTKEVYDKEDKVITFFYQCERYDFKCSPYTTKQPVEYNTKEGLNLFAGEKINREFEKSLGSMEIGETINFTSAHEEDILNIEWMHPLIAMDRFKVDIDFSELSEDEWTKRYYSDKTGMYFQAIDEDYYKYLVVYYKNPSIEERTVRLGVVDINHINAGKDLEKINCGNNVCEFWESKEECSSDCGRENIERVTINKEVSPKMLCIIKGHNWREGDKCLDDEKMITNKDGFICCAKKIEKQVAIEIDNKDIVVEESETIDRGKVDTIKEEELVIIKENSEEDKEQPILTKENKSEPQEGLYGGEKEPAIVVDLTEENPLQKLINFLRRIFG